MRASRAKRVNRVAGFNEEDFAVVYPFDVDFEFLGNVFEGGEVF
jgi:hypothetical protein